MNEAQNNPGIGERARTFIVRRGLFPLQELAKGHRTTAVLREMLADERRPVDELNTIRNRRLGNLLQHAWKTVPYYRDLFVAHQISEKDINPSYLQGLPFLTKDLIRANLEKLKSTAAKKVTKFATGGSTGAPLIFYLGPSRISSDIAARSRAEGWWGLGVGDPEFVLWGSPLEVGKQDKLRAWRDRLMRTELFSAFEMTESMMDGYIRRLREGRYRKIFGYPSSIALLCQRARNVGVALNDLGLKAAFVTGESLTDEWRLLITETLGCSIGNGYGGRDSGFIAHSCPAGSMHTTADRIVVEIVDEAGNPLPNGTTGEIVVTHLDSCEMPLIRYRTGDIGALSNASCPCGRTLPLMDRIEGRQTDFIIAPDGRTMHGLSVVYILREIEGVKQFRITQKSLGLIEVEVVKGEGYSTDQEPRIRDGFCKRLRANVQVQIRYVEQIPSSNSGKFRYVISEVANRRVDGPAMSAFESSGKVDG